MKFTLGLFAIGLSAAALAIEPAGVASLRSHVAQARNAFKPTAGVLVAKRASELDAAFAAAEAFFAAAPEKQRTATQAVVGWSDLQTSRAAGWKDLSVLTLQSKRLYQPANGLELPAVVSIREALDRYLHARRITDGKTDEQLRTEYVEHLTALDTLLQASPLDTDALSAHAAWLAALGQAPVLTEAMRYAFIWPNLIVVVGGKSLKQLPMNATKQINQSQVSHNTILGHPVVGPNTFNAEVKGSVVNTTQGAHLRLNLNGTITSPSNTAYAGKANVYSSGVTAVTAHQDIHWDGGKFFSTPPQVKAVPNTEITGASSNRNRIFPNRRGLLDRVIENVAVKKANESKPEAQSEAAAIAERNVGEQLQKAVDTQLVELNKNVDYYYNFPLGRVGMIPRSNAAQIGTGIGLQFRYEDLTGMGAPSLPAFDSEGDINIYIHESLLANALRPFSSGGNWEDTFFARIQKEATGDYTPEMRISSSGEDRWSLKLDWFRPWSSKISAKGIELIMRARGFTYRGKEYDAAFEIRSTYMPMLTGADDYGFERVGEFKLTLEKPLPAELEKFIASKLEGFLPAQFHLDGLAPPAGGPWDTLSRVKLDRFDLQSGWLCGRFRQG